MSLKRLMLTAAACSAMFFSVPNVWGQTVNPIPNTSLDSHPALSSDASSNARKVPESVANLAAGLLDAVVNISTSQTLKSTEQGQDTPLPDVPNGSPFQEFFNDFFAQKDGKDNDKQSRKVESLGSGFVVDAQKGLVVTNNHVIADADDIEVNFTDGSKLKAKLLGTDTKTDLALLQVEPGKKKLTAVAFGDSETARIGDWVMAVGNPFGLGGTVTVGIISARNRDISSGPYDDFIQTDAAINRGNSGGPLFDMNGKVIGINTAIISPSGGSIGIGFAIPSDMAIGVVKQLEEFGETRRGWLAIRVQPVTQDVADSLKLPKAEGALVAGKIENSKVDNNQIHDGDVIIRFGDRTIKDARNLPRIVAESPVGKVMNVTVLRDGQEKTVKVKLGLLEEKESSDEDSEDADADADEATSNHIMGMKFALLNADTRKQYNIDSKVQGVLVSDVQTNSAADKKRIRKGDVIVDINEELVKTPEDVKKRIDKLKSTGRKNALLIVSGNKGDLRFVTVEMD